MCAIKVYTRETCVPFCCVRWYFS